MAKDALERLFEDTAEPYENYSIDEQLEFEDGNFLNSIGEDAKKVLDSRIEKLEIEEEPEPVEIEEEPEPQVEEPVKRGRGRPRKEPVENITEREETIKPMSENVKALDMNEFMDSLAIDLLNELKESNYKTRNFSKSQMLVIINYLLNKI